MSIRKLIYRLFLSLLAVCFPMLVSANSGSGDNRLSSNSRNHTNYQGWERMIPTHIKLQYAGGMGLLSAGIGWDYGRKNRWETDVMVGLLPKSYSDRFHMTFTLRQNYIPWSVNITPQLALEPFACGVYGNIITGERFWLKEPERYPGAKSYYNFSSRLRFHLYIGQRLTLFMSEESMLKALSLYYELSMNDLMLISRINNRTLKLSDVVHFSIGVKAQLFGD